MKLKTIIFQAPKTFQQKLKQALINEGASIYSKTLKYYDSNELDLYKLNIFYHSYQDNTQQFHNINIPKLSFSETFQIDSILSKQFSLLSFLEGVKDHKSLRQVFKNIKSKDKILLTQIFETTINHLTHLFQFQDTGIEINIRTSQIIEPKQGFELFEVSFSFIEGTYTRFIEFIKNWIEKYHLYFYQYSSIEQSFDLLTAHIPAVCFQTVLKLSPDSSKDAAIRKIVENCLEHLLPNISAISIDQFSAEHIHQTRVAIRRLRSALQSFSDWSNDIDPAWKAQLANLFRAFGSTRDRDAISESLLPKLEKIGAPHLELPKSSESSNKILKLIRSYPTQQLLLDLIEFCQNHTESTEKDDLKKSALKQITHLHHLVCKNAEKFLELDIEEKHQIRKRIKRLRYSLEFTSSLFTPKEVASYLKILKPAQEALGQFNDLCVADTMFKSMVEKEPKLWFSLGWIASEQQHILNLIQQNLIKLAQFKFRDH
nr:CHAD domain-containing protein [Acinetobacter sp. Marseille-Q1620]